jgi:hypothetical protein
MMWDRRDFVAATLATAAIRPPWPNARPIHTPEEFGAEGDGVTNDSEAFGALSRRINAAGGGTVSLTPGRTYIVGTQRPAGSRRFSPKPLLELHDLTRPLAIQGNGARLKAAAGLRFGSFDPHTGEALTSQVPSLDQSLAASPYRAMIIVRGASAPVRISDLELDGNLSGLNVGGRWGDGGWQIPGSGLYLLDNIAEEIVDNVYTHHHPLDGAIISGRSVRSARSRIVRLSSAFNGRQGLSFTGGRGYDFLGCEFARTGRGGLSSAPGAGVDLEAEDNKRVRDLTFTRCRFVDNIGAGLGADTGDTAAIHFSDCEFVGTSNWSAWPRKPGFRFERCTFAGALVHAYSSQDPAAAARFVECRFTDNPMHSPTGRLYFSGGAAGAIVDLDVSDNVHFDGCRFDLRHAGVLPWTWRAIYQNCRMLQLSPTKAMTKGKFLGRNIIHGPVDLYGSMILGDLLLNGKLQARGQVGSDFQAW